jgi:hypothetical protein
MELWQMDVVGRIFLADGVELHAVTGLDDHSRFCVSAKLVERGSGRWATVVPVAGRHSGSPGASRHHTICATASDET